MQILNSVLTTIRVEANAFYFFTFYKPVFMVNIKPMSTIVSQTQSVGTYEQLFVEVILGRPSADCKHLGICKIARVYSNDFHSMILNSICNNSDKIYAVATLQKGVYFELAFQRAFTDANKLAEHFKKGVFVMEEDYLLDESFMSLPVHLKSGTYKVLISDRLLTVRFNNI